jgi:hypothetical protein
MKIQNTLFQISKKNILFQILVMIFFFSNCLWWHKRKFFLGLSYQIYLKVTKVTYLTLLKIVIYCISSRGGLVYRKRALATNVRLDTTGNSSFAVRLRRTTKARKRTAKALPCVFYRGARQRAHNSFLHGKVLLSCAFPQNAW